MSPCIEGKDRIKFVSFVSAEDIFLPSEAKLCF